MTLKNFYEATLQFFKIKMIFASASFQFYWCDDFFFSVSSNYSKYYYILLVLFLSFSKLQAKEPVYTR